MHFRLYLIKIHKSGEVINEQNTYYNEKFYNKPSNIEGQLGRVLATVDNKGKVIKTDTFDGIYLRKKLKTSYDNGKPYFCVQKKFDDEVYANKDSGGIEIDRKFLKRHHSVKTRRPNMDQKLFVDGEDFNEPVDIRPPMFCRHSQGYGQMQNLESRYEGFTQTLDKNGLYDSVFYFYYPPILQVTPPSWRSCQSEFRQVFMDPYYTYYPEPKRSKIPERRLEYVIRYEYFK